MKHLLKIYLHPKANSQGFKIFTFDPTNWQKECAAERNMSCDVGASSMSLHDTYNDAIDQARKELPERLFKICF